MDQKVIRDHLAFGLGAVDVGFMTADECREFQAMLEILSSRLIEQIRLLEQRWTIIPDKVTHEDSI